MIANMRIALMHLLIHYHFQLVGFGLHDYALERKKGNRMSKSAMAVVARPTNIGVLHWVIRVPVYPFCVYSLLVASVSSTS